MIGAGHWRSEKGQSANGWFKTADEAIRWVYETLLYRGSDAAPRGMKTKELFVPTVFTIDEPDRPFLCSAVRRPNYRFGLAEAAWILSGSDDAQLIGRYNSEMLKFSDDGETMWGAYGPRLMGQMAHVVSSIERDPDSRQAVALTWRPQVSAIASDVFNPDGPQLDAAGIEYNRDEVEVPVWDGASWRSKDVPCTISWQFQMRQDRLHLAVYMRSNDAWLGLPYDILSFTTVLRSIAALLNVDVGTYTHVVGNLHLYEQHWALVDEMIDKEGRYMDPPRLRPFDFGNLEDAEAVRRAWSGLFGTGDVLSGMEPYATAIRRDGGNEFRDLFATTRRASIAVDSGAS